MGGLAAVSEDRQVALAVDRLVDELADAGSAICHGLSFDVAAANFDNEPTTIVMLARRQGARSLRRVDDDEVLSREDPLCHRNLSARCRVEKPHQ